MALRYSRCPAGVAGASRNQYPIHDGGVPNKDKIIINNVTNLPQSDELPNDNQNLSIVAEDLGESEYQRIQDSGCNFLVEDPTDANARSYLPGVGMNGTTIIRS